MTHPAYLKEKARELRIKKRLSLLEIADRLALPKTTVFYWIRDLPIPELQYSDTPARARAREKAARVNVAKFKALRDAAYDDGHRVFDALAADPTFRDFVTLFLAEGHKRTRHRLEIANSDPAVLRVSQRWIYKLSKKAPTYSIQYHADQSLDALRTFWAAELGIYPSQIRFQRKSNSNRLTGRTWRSQYGVLTICCNDTYLRSRMQAWMERLRDQWLDSAATRGVAKPGIASGLGPEGRGFKSRHPDRQFENPAPLESRTGARSPRLS
jgi:hypothetical protein